MLLAPVGCAYLINLQKISLRQFVQNCGIFFRIQYFRQFLFQQTALLLRQKSLKHGSLYRMQVAFGDLPQFPTPAAFRIIG